MINLTKIEAYVAVLEAERDDASIDADRQEAGMKEVALLRAANAAACLGKYTRPLLDEAKRYRAVVDAAQKLTQQWLFAGGEAGLAPAERELADAVAALNAEKRPRDGETGDVGHGSAPELDEKEGER